MMFKNLRTLSRKSTLCFGKYAECTVGQLLDCKRLMYLRWIYYNCSMINYQEDILNALQIDQEWRIDKPGLKPGMEDELNDYIHGRVHGFDKLKLKMRLSKQVRIAKFRYDNMGRSVESKKVMQARNQNKYK